jgi:prevent-host-death family protein
MTVHIGVFEAKTHFSELVERVSTTGEDVIITKRGKPVARILPTSESASPIEDALQLLLAAREESTKGDGTLRELIDDGRAR